jgi:NADH-quinone oxidoreductase subunit M
MLIGVKTNPKNFDEFNIFFSNEFSGLFKFDSMGISWLYISSFIILFCQLILFSKARKSNNWTPFKINYKSNWITLIPENSYTWWLIYLFIIQVSLTFLFLTDNIIVFYISFETTLLPFFLWIGEAAIRGRRWHAVFFLTFFTLLGSIGMLWAITILYKINNSFIISEYIFSMDRTRNLYSELMWEKCTRCTAYGKRVEITFETCLEFFNSDLEGDSEDRISLWVAFLLFTFSFLIKFPVFPVASWLCEAHVEASTEASVLLAAVLLKVAPYGFYKLIIPSFQEWYFSYRSILWIIGLSSALLYAIALLSQTDLKRSIAYTSIIHMSIMLCLMANASKTSLESAFLMGALHSFCSAGLFCCIGYLYDKDKTKNIHYVSGMLDLRPVFSTFFLLFNLSNIGYPLIGSYISESLLFVVSTASSNHIYTSVVALVLYFLTGSVFFMTSKILYRSWVSSDKKKVLDLSNDERNSLLLLFTICVLLSIFPSIYLSYIEDSISLVSESLYHHIKHF